MPLGPLWCVAKASALLHRLLFRDQQKVVGIRGSFLPWGEKEAGDCCIA